MPGYPKKGVLVSAKCSEASVSPSWSRTVTLLRLWSIRYSGCVGAGAGLAIAGAGLALTLARRGASLAHCPSRVTIRVPRLVLMETPELSGSHRPGPSTPLTR